MDLKTKIREIPDFPKEGILFKDITTLLKDKEAFNKVIDKFAAFYNDEGVQKVVGIESRGFIFGAPLAYQLNAGFVPVRKPGKLPSDVYEAKYELEYGTDTLAIHQDAISPGENVLIVDDLLATGGTMSAAVDLIRQLGGTIVGIAFLIELAGLKGRDKLNGQSILSLITY
ncbi:MAG: adenine phosphoribosyltransferase [Nitrospirae bacterium]|nr:adenine phosphoribosyltransferase [Nitrospirota bacterium]